MSEAEKRPLLSEKGVVALALCILAGFCAVCAFVLWEMRRDVEREARIAAENLVTAVARDIARNIELYDLSLHAVINNLKEPEVANVSARVRHLVLFDRSTTAKHMGDILVTDADGNITIDSQSLLPRLGNVSDRDYFKFHRDHPTFDLYVSKPFKGRFSNEWSIAISRRLTNPDRSFAGIVVGTLRVSYFRDLFHFLDLGPNGTMTLFAHGGTVVMRVPADHDLIGRDLTLDPQFRLGPGKTSGSFVGNAVTDGIHRLFTYRQIGDYPLVLSLGTSTDAIFQRWRNRVVFLGAIGLALCAASLTLLVLLRREFIRRRASEEKFETLATTDALTGLANRRLFDQSLAREWARCARHRRPLTLLLLDTDQFKLYNDTFGHQSGDEVLRAIGSTISAAVRETDHAARIGGEEFAILLPEATVGQAKRVAERIRSGFAELGIPHPESSHRVATVSIGMASTIPSAGEPVSSLVHRADVALYAAKRGGRNRIELEKPLRSEALQLKSA